MDTIERLLIPGKISLCVAALLLSACGDSEPDPGAGDNSGGKAPTKQVRFLDQGFTDDDRQAFYYLSQGSQLLPYDWFLSLEQVDSEALFRNDMHMRGLGYIPQPPDPAKNPDGLPIGFVKDDNPDTVNSFAIKKAFLGADYKRENYPTTNAWIGLTCAACHTTQIDYKGESIRIDGGAALVDHQVFMERLAAALEATYRDPEKMNRFARSVLKPNWSQGEQDALNARVVAYSGVLNRLVQRNATDLAYGYGRLDAFGAILNRVCETGLEIPDNHAESNAPVSFPFLWLTPQLDWVQWNSAVSSPIARNTGEVMGVYAHLQLTGTPETGQFNSTVRLHNLDRIESYVEKLKAPAWPADVFGPIDETKASQGKSLFAANCEGCHSVRDADGKFPSTPPNAFGKQFVITHAPPLQKLGTDPQMVDNVKNRTADPGALRPYLDESLKDLPRVPAAAVLGAAVGGVIKSQLARENLKGDALREAAVRLNGMRTPDQLSPPLSIVVTYKARPLDGIWATAPYLHNGSVPSLYQLLLPEDRRVGKFGVGSREFDPVDVGYATDTGFELDTSLPGNRNTGHSGPGHTQTRDSNGNWRDFSTDERWALVEYLKTLR